MNCFAACYDGSITSEGMSFAPQSANPILIALICGIAVALVHLVTQHNQKKVERSRFASETEFAGPTIVYEREMCEV